MALRPFLYSLQPKAAERFFDAYRAAPRPHLARPEAAAILDLGRRPERLVTPFEAVSLVTLSGPWPRSSPPPAMWAEPLLGEGGGHEAAAAAVSGRRRVLADDRSARPATYLDACDVRAAASVLKRTQAREDAVRDALAARLAPLDDAHAWNERQKRERLARAAEHVSRHGLADTVLFLLTKRPPRTVVSALETLLRPPVPPDRFHETDWGGLADHRNALRGAIRRWNEDATSMARLRRALARFYDAAAARGHLVVVERA